MKQRHLTPEQLAEAVTLYRRGTTLETIARKLGYGRDVISRELMAAHVKVSERRAPIQDESLRAEIVALYESGLRVTDVAAQIDLDAHRISNVLREEHVTIRGKNAINYGADSPARPPLWAVTVYAQRLGRGMPEPVARRMSNLTPFAPDAIAQELARIAPYMGEL